MNGQQGTKLSENYAQLLSAPRSNSQESIVLILTGIGLKATETLSKYVSAENE